MKIGEKLRMIREMKGLSQEAIATNLNISPQAYGKIEREETKLDYQRITEIAKIMDLKAEDIVNFDGQNIFNNSSQAHSTGNFNINNNKEGMVIIEKLLATIDGRFEKYDRLLDSNMKIIEKFGELIKS
jgi:transcriptional regulator with XRE-family HTH domain